MSVPWSNGRGQNARYPGNKLPATAPQSGESKEKKHTLGYEVVQGQMQSFYKLRLWGALDKKQSSTSAVPLLACSPTHATFGNE
jgi:hypothetical protein